MSILSAKKAALPWLCVCSLIFFHIACDPNKYQKQEPAPVERATVAEPPARLASTIASSPEMDARLLLADRHDGSEDKVVARCGGCALHMDGSAAHALTVGDYQMHFCSDFCQKTFADKPEESVLALAVPEAP